MSDPIENWTEEEEQRQDNVNQNDNSGEHYYRPDKQEFKVFTEGERELMFYLLQRYRENLRDKDKNYPELKKHVRSELIKMNSIKLKLGMPRSIMRKACHEDKLSM